MRKFFRNSMPDCEDKIMNKNYFHRLRCRRTEVEKTLRHLENERRTVESNTEWANRAAFESRMNLLYRLTDSFRNEIGRIDDALKRRASVHQLLCFSCARRKISTVRPRSSTGSTVSRSRRCIEEISSNGS